jgi:hypothetical protein
MTVATVKSVVTRFLTSEVPEVLALKGDWGVGKTFTWNKLVEQHSKEIKLPNYCYVSLFGMSSITELRTAIIAKTRSTRLIGKTRDAKTISTEWSTLGKETLKSGAGFLSKFKDAAYVKNVSITLEALAPYLIRNTIVCFDDFERLSKVAITHDMLLGFISELKEEKGCKVVLIFNEDKLEDESSYKKYREKVIDIELEFAPTCSEAADIALPGKLACRELIKECAVSLDIKNIRILRKIVAFTEMLHVAAKGLDGKVMEMAARTLVLLTWAHYGSDERKPTVNFIMQWSALSAAVQARNKDEDNDHKLTEWGAVLSNYGYAHADKFDFAINKVIERGYLEESGFLEQAKKLDEKIRANDLQESFSAAWKMYNNSFAANGPELVEALSNSLKESVSQVSPRDLNSTICLLRDLCENELANELIDFYIAARSSEGHLFNTADTWFHGDVTDQVIRERFDRRYAEGRSLPELREAVEYIAANNGWSEEHIESLKMARAEDFYHLFKLEHGDNLSRIVNACLRFKGTGEHEAISQRAQEALTRIGSESSLNARRVKRYGFTGA